MRHTALTGGVLAAMLMLQPSVATAQTVPGIPAVTVGDFAYNQEQYRSFEWIGLTDDTVTNPVNFLGNWNASAANTATLKSPLPTISTIIPGAAPGQPGWVRQDLTVRNTDQRITDYTGVLNVSSNPRFTPSSFMARMPNFAVDTVMNDIDIENGSVSVDSGKTVSVNGSLLLRSIPGVHASTQNGANLAGTMVANYRTYLQGNVNAGGLVNTGTIQTTGLYNYANGNRAEVFVQGPSEIGVRILAQGNTDIIFNPYNSSTNYTVKYTGLLDAATGRNMALAAGEGTFIYMGPKSVAMTGFTVASGKLQIGDGGTVGELPIDSDKTLTLAAGARVIFNRSDDFTIANVISGAGGLTKQGAGILTLTGANTYTGTTLVEAGTLKLGTGGSLNAASLITVNSGATFDFGAISNPTVGSLGGTGGSLTGGTGNLTVQMANGTTDTFSGTNPFGGFNSLILSGSGTLNLSGDLSGSKGITISGGTLNLTGNNTLTGGITVNGKLIIGSNNGAGGAGNSITTTGSVISYANGVTSATPITINSNTTQLEVAGTDSATQAGVISETGGARPLEKIGTGTLVLGDGMNNPLNTFSGAFTISAGTVAIRDTRNLGSDSSTNRLILNGGTLSTGSNVVGMSRPFTVSANGGTVNNTQLLAFQGDNNVFDGRLTKTGSGVLVLTGTASGSGGIFVDEGVLSLGQNSSAGTGTLTMSGGTTLRGRTDGMVIANNIAIQGKGGITLEREFSGVNYTISGNISGNSSLSSILKAQDGTINLTGNNTFQGGVTLSAGTLGVGSNTALGTGSLSAQVGTTLKAVANVSLANNIVITSGMSSSPQFTVDTSGSNMTLSGVISTSVPAIEPVQPGLTKDGAGNLTLTGTNTYRGATIVNAGKLIVNGSISNSSSVTVANGATLGGNAAIPNLTVQSGASISPGNSIGTVTIAGNLTLSSGSVTVIEIQQSQSDQINAGGTASVAGTLQLVALGGPYSFGTPYTILTATGGVSGSFGTVTTDGAFGVGVTSSVAYSASSVQVTLNAAPLTQAISATSTTSSGGSTLALTRPRNVYAVASAMDAAVAAGANPSAFFNVYNQPTRDALAAAVNTLSGEVHTVANAVGVQASDQFLRVMLDPTAVGRNGALFGPAEGKSRYAVWASIYGQSNRANGDAFTIGSAKRSGSDGHFAVGGDIRLTPETVVGFAVSGGEGRGSLGAMGSARSDVYQTGLYAMTRFGGLSLGMSGSYGALETTTQRSIPTLSANSVQGSYRAQGWNGRIEAAYAAYATNGVTISPFGALQAHSIKTPTFIERDGVTGTAIGVFSTGTTNVTSRSEIGARVDASGTVGGMNVMGYARIGWAHYLKRDSDFTASLIGLPGAAFKITGARVAQDAALVTIGGDVEVTRGVFLGGRFDGEFASSARTFAGNVRLRVAF